MSDSIMSNAVLYVRLDVHKDSIGRVRCIGL